MECVPGEECKQISSLILNECLFNFQVPQSKTHFCHVIDAGKISMSESMDFEISAHCRTVFPKISWSYFFPRNPVGFAVACWWAELFYASDFLWEFCGLGLLPLVRAWGLTEGASWFTRGYPEKTILLAAILTHCAEFHITGKMCIFLHYLPGKKTGLSAAKCKWSWLC